MSPCAGLAQSPQGLLKSVAPSPPQVVRRLRYVGPSAHRPDSCALCEA